MFFLMECRHNPDVADLRDSLRATHRDWVKSGGNGLASVLIGSAMWDDTGGAIGHWGILEAEDPEKARAFADGDPFATEGVVDRTTVTRLADTFMGARITPRMTV
jgi:hypothetical protein